jgi:tRNA pseudouridine-54 N-methylase
LRKINDEKAFDIWYTELDLLSKAVFLLNSHMGINENEKTYLNRNTRLREVNAWTARGGKTEHPIF